MSTPIIRASGLTKRFGAFTAVDNLEIAVEPGVIFAFLGANGSGKSTTIRMLIGLLQPTAGVIEVDGVDVIRHPRRVREHIGYMGQKVSLYQGLSLRENVEFYAGLYGLSNAQMEASWGALRERFELGAAEGAKAEELPAGLRQRAGLAVSIIHRPRVLFLDEPTAGVDVHSRSVFWDLIQQEAREGATVFVTTHFLEEVDYCDWVTFIDAGRLIANDRPEALRRRFSAGYEVFLPADAAHQQAAYGALQRLVGSVERTADGLRASFNDATPELLTGIDRLSSELETPVEIRQVPMADVFRRVVEQAEAGAVQ